MRRVSMAGRGGEGSPPPAAISQECPVDGLPRGHPVCSSCPHFSPSHPFRSLTNDIALTLFALLTPSLQAIHCDWPPDLLLQEQVTSALEEVEAEPPRNSSGGRLKSPPSINRRASSRMTRPQSVLQETALCPWCCLTNLCPCEYKKAVMGGREGTDVLFKFSECFCNAYKQDLQYNPMKRKSHEQDSHRHPDIHHSAVEASCLNKSYKEKSTPLFFKEKVRLLSTQSTLFSKKPNFAARKVQVVHQVRQRNCSTITIKARFKAIWMVTVSFLQKLLQLNAAHGLQHDVDRDIRQTLLNGQLRSALALSQLLTSRHHVASSFFDSLYRTVAPLKLITGCCSGQIIRNAFGPASRDTTTAH
ncbi:hypothetical protein CDAR_50441 [Caerostris darwini]|uniref:Uncharacterized protein n=1 Tax=Caerostris darwini TaxID=1538125 RepID=A0AAV4UWX7_9ARAC|nr:hypothetical protein CDAR_50441 [Caerostris darwini]